MLRKLFFLFFFTQFLCIGLSAQSKTIDSLHSLVKKDRQDINMVIHLGKISREYVNLRNYDTAMVYSNRSLKLAEYLNLPGEIATVYNNIGNIYHYKGNYVKALENYFVSLKLREEIGDQNGIADSYNNIGNIYYLQSDYGLALKNHLASLKFRKETGNKKGIATSYNNIGNIYCSQGNYTRALENQLASLKLKEEIGDKDGIAESYNNIGNIYASQKNYAKALEIYLASLKIEEEIGDKRDIIRIYNNMGELYRNQGNYAKALRNYCALLKIEEEIGDKKGIAASYMNIGNTYIAKNNYAEASTYLLNSLQMFKELGIKNGMAEAYQRLSEVSEKMNDYTSAYKYQQQYSQIKDSIFNEKNSKQIAEIQAKYEIEKKDKAIEMQSLQLSKQQLQLTQNKILQAFLFIGILFVIIIAFLLYNRNKIKQREFFKTNLLEQQHLHTKAIINTQEQERTHIARDLHDGIGQTLAGIITNYEELNTEINSFSEEKQKKFRQVTKSLDEAYEELREISHRMMPRALKVVGLSEAISDLLDKTLANRGITYSLTKADMANTPESIAIGIYRIFQELLSNILKHSRADKISVQLFNNKNQLILIVEDNGIGISKSKTDPENAGIGLRNITARAQAMQGSFIFESGTVEGTVATVIIPLTDNNSIIKQKP